MNENEEKVSAGQAKYTEPKVATFLIPQDAIVVNLAATSPDGQRLAVSATFDYMGQPINLATRQRVEGILPLDLGTLSGKAAPEFPLAKYNELLETGQKEAAEDLKEAHNQASADFEEDGNQPLPHAIADAVLAWADKSHNVKTYDHAGPVIKPEQVVVRQVVRNYEDEPGLFSVSLTPAWGK